MMNGTTGPNEKLFDAVELCPLFRNMLLNLFLPSLRRLLRLQYFQPGQLIGNLMAQFLFRFLDLGTGYFDLTPGVTDSPYPSDLMYLPGVIPGLCTYRLPFLADCLSLARPLLLHARYFPTPGLRPGFFHYVRVAHVRVPLPDFLCFALYFFKIGFCHVTYFEG